MIFYWYVHFLFYAFLKGNRNTTINLFAFFHQSILINNVSLFKFQFCIQSPSNLSLVTREVYKKLLLNFATCIYKSSKRSYNTYTLGVGAILQSPCPVFLSLLNKYFGHTQLRNIPKNSIFGHQLNRYELCYMLVLFQTCWIPISCLHIFNYLVICISLYASNNTA